MNTAPTVLSPNFEPFVSNGSIESSRNYFKRFHLWLNAIHGRKFVPTFNGHRETILLSVIGARAFDFLEKKLSGVNLAEQPFRTLQNILVFDGTIGLKPMSDKPSEEQTKRSWTFYIVFALIVLIFFSICASKPPPSKH